MPDLDDIFVSGQNVPMAQLKAYLEEQEAAVSGLDLSSEGRASANSAFDTILADIPIVSAEDGTAQAGVDLDTLFQGKYVGIGTAKYISPQGSDSNSGNSWAAAYLTLAKINANSGVACDTVYMAPGDYDFCDFRYTHTGGTSPRRFVAPFGGVRFRTSGSAVSGLTFTVNGTYSNVYEATLAATPILHRLLRTDVVDRSPHPELADLAGKPIPLPYHTSLANLATAGYGWFHDTTGTKLYVAMFGADVDSFKANLQGVYYNAGGNRLLLWSTISYWEGFTFEGYVDALFVTGQLAPVAYFKNCGFEYSATTAILAEGATVYTQDCTAYRPAADGGNYNISSGQACLWAEINFRTLFCGDEDSYPGQTSNAQGVGFYNKNGSSNHNGVGIRIGGFHDGSSGPLISDVLTSSVRSKTWSVGVGLGRSRAPLSSGNSYGILVQNADAWVENMSVPDSATGAILSDGTAIINNFGLKGNRTGGGTFTAYTPVAA